MFYDFLKGRRNLRLNFPKERGIEALFYVGNVCKSKTYEHEYLKQIITSLFWHYKDMGKS